MSSGFTFDDFDDSKALPTTVSSKMDHLSAEIDRLKSMRAQLGESNPTRAQQLGHHIGVLESERNRIRATAARRFGGTKGR